MNEEDKKWMSLALEIADRGAGYVSPNPMVGCVIVSAEGEKIAQGIHEQYGQAHAERNAVNSVSNKELLDGATVYVTLEPCAHHGNTPPCCELLAELPIGRVVVAMEDPTPKVAGKGIEYLRDHDIDVKVGILEEQAERLNEFFLHHQKWGRPFVALKIAQTLDGYIAAPDGDSEWISGQHSRALVHKWRSKYDAVMVGRNTALLDNPRLTVRHVEGRQPKRVVIDGPLELPDDLNLFTDQYEEKTIVITHNEQKYREEADPMLNMLKSDYFRGSTLLVDEKNGHTNLADALKELGKQPITSILVEAGQSLASALLRENLVDKVECFIAPKMLGGGTRSVLGVGINHMSEIMEFREVEWKQVGDDILFSGYF
ncbi:bifunctional diaminohydroxyphosphoribosylaminopyrimidine deaminase/5-amino-6-(5-phosphoribosylamino)uracil reductase RibD [Fodinibius saliphilus]|uniref:bifunctional diaminohydroxyphosphoribosylaminopyrimidine deaminase/5-amino-6-(5-phosphoribosylamino)uracil reductase RibD n=1 Tax=Fodinibius saliphilus TaxID=1920650 RepID=UPI00110832F2|nr:bifunctional diaminohydroxyphosphoribosylaminopyrimidine deaminase/5-amino-6-(5-phosphoribosylamino)uracil reductase RibD [Fodinibius saliphilus]